MAILAVACTEMEQAGLEPFSSPFVIQLEPLLHGVDVLVTTYYFYIIMARLMGLSCSLAEDQNFDRQTWLRSQPNLVPCLLPSGKYISTVRWTLLSAKDWFPQLFLLVAFARRKPDFRE